VRHRSLLLAALSSSWVACFSGLSSAPSAPIGPLPLAPQGLRPDAFAEARLAVFVDPAIPEQRTLTAVSLRDIELVALRSSVVAGLTRALGQSFAEIREVEVSDPAGLVLRLEELTPQHVKTGNVPVSAGAVVYEMRFDVRYRAALGKEADTLASAVGTYEGRDLSWRAEDQPLMLQRALEGAITEVLEKLFADEALVRAGGRVVDQLGAKTAMKQRTPQNTVAVMPLRGVDVPKKKVTVLDDLLVVAMDTASPLAVISTQDINAMLGHERLKDAMGCDDISCAAEIGGALGVDYLLTGSVNKLGSNVIVTLHLLNTRTHASLARGKATVRDDEDLYQQAVDQAVRDLLGVARVQ
jgi:TolB-like protein